MTDGWNTADIPSQTARVAVITGATGGLGLASARALAHAGARVIIAARNPAKAAHVIATIHQHHPNADVEFELLDTADLASVRAFADRWSHEGRGIDVLLLNAGISNVPTRETTVDGLERQFATNYLGHFALTAQLLPFIVQAAGSRIVAVSSLQHAHVELHLDDLQLTADYTPMRAYGQSKLAILMFALELDRRLQQAHSPVAAVAAHPGVATTGITSAGGRANRIRRFLATTIFELIGQPPAQGALPLLFAATDPHAHRGGYYGPDGRGERRGAPAPAQIAPRAQDHDHATRLWSISQQLSDVTYEFDAN